MATYTSRNTAAAKELPQLSCKSCTERKVRCDKCSPCTRCDEAGIVCIPVYRQRRPRGRHSRVANSKDQDCSDPTKCSKASTLSSSTSLDDHVTRSSSQSIPFVEKSTRTLGTAVHLTSNNAGVDVTFLDAALALRPDAAFRSNVCKVYMERVDPIVKLFHRPSLQNFLLHDTPYPGCKKHDDVLDVILSSVILISLVSLNEEQCHAEFAVEKANYLRKYRLACEMTLDRSGLIHTEDITILQAYVAYLLAIRSYDRSRTPWTLVSVAVRIAVGLGINDDSNFASETFFQQQMRRRLWYTICLLDIHSSFDRISEPLISPDSTHPKLPMNINDTDFGPRSAVIVSARDGLTDMSLALLLFHAQATGKILGFQQPTLPRSATLDIRKQLVEQFEFHVKRLGRHCTTISSPYAWCTLNGSLHALASMQLYLEKPRKSLSSNDSSKDSRKVLRLAAECLEHDLTMRSDPRGEPFRWWRLFHWHPLTVAMTECCSCNDVDLIREVWPLLELHFEEARKRLSVNNRVLWASLERLMLRCRSYVSALLQRPEGSHSLATQVTYSAATSTLDTYSDPSPESVGTCLATPGTNKFQYPHAAYGDMTSDETSVHDIPSVDLWDNFLDDFGLNTNDDLMTQLLAECSSTSMTL